MRDPNEPIWDSTSSDLDIEPLPESNHMTADKGNLVRLDPAELWERYLAETDFPSAQGAMAFAADVFDGDVAMLIARLAEHEANVRAYEEIIGKKTYQEVADEIAVLQARGDLAVQNRNHWQQEAESMGFKIESARKALKILSDPNSWRLNGRCDPNSGNFDGETIAYNALKDIPK